MRTFDRGGELGHLSHIRVLDGAGERPLTGQSEDLLQRPAWSPDGRQIAFARQLDWDQPYRSEIVVIPVDGGPERVVWRQRQDERSTDVGQPACFYNEELY